MLKKIVFFGIACCTLFFAFNQNYLNKISDFFNTSDLNIKETRNAPLAVHILDVGKGDSIFITCEDKNILIDAGEYEAHNKPKEFLKRQNIKKLDLVVATHPHSDHIGGMAEIIKNFDIETFVSPELPEKLTPVTKCYKNMLLALKEKNISLKYPDLEKQIKLGSLSVNFLAPCRKYEDMNNNSIVVLINYKDKKFLFMGDAEKQSENDILNKNPNLKVDFLKVGHHGSATSSSESFLKTILPEYAAISVGENPYGSPNKGVITRLEKYNIKIFRTDFNGNITFTTDGDNIQVFKEKGE